MQKGCKMKRRPIHAKKHAAMVHCIHVAVSKVTSGKVLRDGVERIDT